MRDLKIGDRVVVDWWSDEAINNVVTLEGVIIGIACILPEVEVRFRTPEGNTIETWFNRDRVRTLEKVLRFEIMTQTTEQGGRNATVS